VNYLRPVPLHQPLRVESYEVEAEGRQHINMAEISNENNEVLARGRGIFIAIDAEKMFAKYAKK
jgi:acyl-CoA thioesterase FadM